MMIVVAFTAPHPYEDSYGNYLYHMHKHKEPQDKIMPLFTTDLSDRRLKVLKQLACQMTAFEPEKRISIMVVAKTLAGPELCGTSRLSLSK